MIPQTFIQDLLHRVDIVEVVDRYVQLKQAGANYVACCPFHSEKTPVVLGQPGKQFYHCFGCGAHGTAIGFLMEYAGMAFRDAVEGPRPRRRHEVPSSVERALDKRAARAGERSVRASCSTPRSSTGAQLKDAPRAIDYLKGRGL